MSARLDQRIVLVDDSDEATITVGRGDDGEWRVKQESSTHVLVSAEDVRAFAQLILDTVPEP